MNFHLMIQNRWLGFKLTKIINYFEYLLLKLYKDPNKLKVIRDIMKQDSVNMLKPSDLFILYSIAKRQSNLKGDFAELGTYRGTSSSVICEVKGDKNFYVFDTFDGLPQSSGVDNINFTEGIFKGNYPVTKKRLSKYPYVYIRKGFFPDTAKDLKHKKFAFAHFEANLYRSAKDFIEFFYPKLVKGGILLIHDYPYCAGVKKAVDEYFTDNEIIELPLLYGMVIKNDIRSNN